MLCPARFDHVLLPDTAPKENQRRRVLRYRKVAQKWLSEIFLIQNCSGIELTKLLITLSKITGAPIRS